MNIKATRTMVAEFDVDLNNYPEGTETFEDIVKIEKQNFAYDSDMMFDILTSDKVKFELIEK